MNPNRSPRPSASQSVDEPLLPSLPSTDDLTGGLLGACPLASVGGYANITVSCPTEPECFRGININSGNATAAKADCNRTHTWETFLIGDLPSDVKSSSYDEVAGNAVVKVLCGAQGMQIALNGESTAGWSAEVLPPTETEYAAGKRKFRCVAGKGLDKLNRSYFVKD